MTGARKDTGFGQYLVAEQLITKKDLLVMLSEQRARQTRLGQIALAHGTLTVQQVFEILETNYEETDRAFGQTAIELGFLTATDLTRLLEIQRTTRPPLGELVIQFGLMDEEALQTHLKIFEWQREGKDKADPAPGNPHL